MNKEQIIKEIDNFLQDPVFGKLLNRNAAIALAQHFHDLVLSKQWISVEDELPEKDKDDSNTSIYVLVTDNSNPFGYVWKAYYDFTIKAWYDAMSCENLSKYNITHWMSIPKIGGEDGQP